ncbi:hypothetical protein CVT24_001286 [Panaeolus cyanescens]|uniref:Uncharacterized protein n=1 Tax=Panaeolus cyanescens TaxID=181874 RepID=A0A409YYZ3_9AGAR|nr:hypothetical protein CVT24_001286 [Panaeolus cyanescens]
MSPDGSIDSKAIMNAVSLPLLQTSFTNSKSQSSSSPPTTKSTWHTIRPWTPALSLVVREITSVSATFILGSTLHINGQPNAQIDPSLASLALEAAATPDEEDDLESATKEQDQSQLEEQNSLLVKPQVISREDSSSSSSRTLAKDTARRRRKPTNSVVADALSKGLSVTVNGAAWPRAFIRINEELDEAVIIIYALMPGRQYDIELELAPGVHAPSLHRQVTTTEDDSDEDSTETHTDPESPSLENSTASSSDPLSTPSTSPSRTAPGTPPMPTGTVAAAVAPPITLEERLAQLQHTLSMVNAERETLLASLKSARRDSQKADSALRSEIDTLKRASEKNAAAELRGKQKVLALQEAVKRTRNSIQETRDMVKGVEEGLPELNQQREKMEKEYEATKAEATRARKEREEKEEKERKDMESLKTELGALNHKLERLTGKREKLEKSVIPELEEKLKDVEKEIADEERDLQLWIEREEQRSKVKATLFGETSPSNASFVPVQRPRTLDAPGTMGRLAPGPISRPSLADGSNGPQSAPLWSPLQRQVQAHIPVQHNPRSPSLPVHGSSPVLLTSQAQRQSSLRSNGSLPGLNPSLNNSNSSFTSSISTPGMLPPGLTNGLTSSPTSTSTNSSPVSAHQHANTSTTSISSTSATGSTLSSRAPVFEPSSKIVNGTSHPHFLSAHTSNTTFSPQLHQNVINTSPTATHPLPAPIQRPQTLSTKPSTALGAPGLVPMRSPHAQTSGVQGQNQVTVQHTGVPVHSQRPHPHAPQQGRER